MKIIPIFAFHLIGIFYFTFVFMKSFLVFVDFMVFACFKMQCSFACNYSDTNLLTWVVILKANLAYNAL